jgi:hypothetical protein
MAINIKGLASFGAKKLFYAASADDLAWSDITIESGKLRFPADKGIEGPGGLAKVGFPAGGDLYFSHGTGDASLFFKQSTAGYNASKWGILSADEGYGSNMFKMHIHGVSTATAKAAFVWWDNNNGTYPMGWAYQWDGTSPSRSFNNWVGFIDDSTTWIFKVNDMCHAIAGQMEVNGQLTLKKMGDVGAITVTPQGTSGATAYSYKAVAELEDGTKTEAATTGSTATGHATLDGTNFNRITFDPWLMTGFMSPVKTWKIYRTVGGAAQGLIIETNIGSNAPFQFDDTGLVANAAEMPPTVNATGNLNIEGSIKGIEQEAAPAAPAAGGWVQYAIDNAGKTEVYIKFATGAAQLVAAQP